MAEEQLQNFTDKELQFSYWYITHKLLLAKILVIFLSFICLSVWFYVGLNMYFFGVNYNVENYQIRRLLFEDNMSLSILASSVPRSFQVSDPIYFSGADNRNDYYVEISNSNGEWLITFDYEFDGVSGSPYVRNGFVLPTQKKFLMDLGVEGNVSGIKITDIKWERVANFEREYNERFRFTVSNEEFIAGSISGDPNRLIFNITNHSAYNYWQIGVQTFLQSGGNIVSINYIILEQFKSGETRAVELNFEGRLPRISGINVVPDINVFDENNIMPQEAPREVPIH